jgi:hypothetical protein
MAVGLTYFAAFMMILGGAFDALQGLSAILRQNVYAVTPDYVYKLNVSTWGWINLILGIVILLAGAALLNGAVWARTIGVIMAILVGISNFLWLPYYPVWSIIIITISVLVVWALTAHGRDAAS